MTGSPNCAKAPSEFSRGGTRPRQR
jgi:hypothetical protein